MSNFSYLPYKTIIFNNIKNYFRDFQFNIIAPIISIMIFVFILSTIDRFYTLEIYHNSYLNFLIPGIIISVVMQTSFNYISEIIIDMKHTGSFNDYLISPISRTEILLSFIISSLIVVIISTLFNLFILSFFTDFNYINFYQLFYYLVICILIFSFLGALIGFLSFTWDTQSTFSTFIISPVSFLSGTFFSINSLPEKYKFILLYNPFYHIVEGFRSSFINQKNDLYIFDFYILFILTIVILFTLYIFKIGYRVIQ